MPFTYRSKENLNTIKQINSNINVPKNLVNQSYILSKFNIQYTTINKMIKMEFLNLTLTEFQKKILYQKNIISPIF